MSKLWALFQLMRKNSTYQSISITTNKKNSLSLKLKNLFDKKYFSVIFYGLSFLISLIFIFNLLNITSEQDFLNIFLITSIAPFIFQIMFSISMGFYLYYLNNDLESYLVLPITNNQLLITRLLYVCYYSYFFTLITTIPLLIWYMFNFGISLYGLAALIFGSLLSIATPTILPIIILFLFVSVFKFLKSKNSISYLFYILVFGLSIGWQFIGKNLGILITSNSLNSNYHISDFIINTSLIAKALNNQSVVPIIVLIIFSIILLGVYLFLGNVFYVKNATRLSEANSKKKAVNYNKIKIKKNSIIKTFLSKEFKSIFHSPHTVIQFLISPIFIFMAFFGGMIYAFITEKVQIDQIISGLNSAIALIPTFFGHDYSIHIMIIIGLVLATVQFMCSANACTISREGTMGIDTIKTWPIKFSDVLLAKVLVGPIINLFVYIIPLTILLFVIDKKIYVLIMIITFLIANYFVGWYSLFINVLFPKFNWSNEMQVIKNSLSVNISVFTMFGIGALTYFSFFTLKNIYLVIATLSIVPIIGIIGMIYCLTNHDKILKKLNESK